MDIKLTFWTTALCAGVALWLVLDIKSSGVDYKVHDYLIDKRTGRPMKPSEVMNLTQVFKMSEGYINSTNPEQRLYQLVHNMNLENSLITDQNYYYKGEGEMSGWPVANKTKCAQQLAWIRSEFERVNDSYQVATGRRGLELAQLVGSIGKPEAGVFASGATSWMGSYERCTQLTMGQEAPSAETGAPGGFAMRYCWARLRFKSWPKESLAWPPTVVRVGVCLPETCDTQAASSRTLAKQIGSLIKIDWPRYYEQNLEYESIFCLPDERSPIREMPTAGWLYLYALYGWLAVVLAATILYEVHQHKMRRLAGKVNSVCELEPPISKSTSAELAEYRYCADNQSSFTTGTILPKFIRILDALSVHCSIKRFKSHRFRVNYSKLEPTERPRVDLSCLDFFKVGMAILIVLGHGALLGSSYSRSLVNRINLNLGLWGSMALSIGRSVDTFFLFFGLLTTYSIMRKFSTRQLVNPMIWLGVNLGILLRITPVFMLIYCYARLVAPYSAAGPWWDYGVSRFTMRGLCMHEPWWKSIPYLGCQGSPAISPCVPPAWFIVSYSQVSLILPLITYIIIQLPNRYLRSLLVAFLSLLSILQFVIKLSHQSTVDTKSYTLYGAFIIDLLEKFESSGQMSTLSRIGCIAVGCYVGYLLRRYELGEIKEWPNWLRWRSTLIIAIFLNVIVFFLPAVGFLITECFQRESDLREAIIGNAICMVIWPLLNSVLIICGTSLYHHMAWVRFFSHPFWHAFNKLGLIIYLIHWEILSFGLISYESGPSHGAVIDVLKLWTYSLTFTIIFSFAIHVLFEAPLTELLMILSGSIITKKTQVEKYQVAPRTNDRQVDS